MLRDENEDGSAREDVFFDDHKPSHWDNKLSANCVVQICSAQQWLAITGNKPPQPAIAPEVFSKNNIPWLDRYDAELQALKNADRAVAKSAKSRSTPTDLKSSSSE